jgi:hypothetical protein
MEITINIIIIFVNQKILSSHWRKYACHGHLMHELVDQEDLGKKGWEHYSDAWMSSRQRRSAPCTLLDLIVGMKWESERENIKEKNGRRE